MMTKREIFKQAFKAYEDKQNALYDREPELKLYEQGEISWQDYLRLSNERKVIERETYKDNENYALYDAGLITWEEFEATF